MTVIKVTAVVSPKNRDWTRLVPLNGERQVSVSVPSSIPEIKDSEEGVELELVVRFPGTTS